VNPYLEFATTTNATRLSEEVLTGLQRFKRLALTVSMDGCTKEVFEPIRLRGNFEEVVGNLDRLIALSKAHPSAHISVTFSVMKANLAGLPDLMRFCAAKGIGFNLLPVIAYPVDQSLRSFNNPERQMDGWRESLDQSHRLFESEFVKKRLVNATLAEVHRSHFSALEGHIPWRLLQISHFHVQARLGATFLSSYRPAKSHQELLMGFFPLQIENGRECLYYSPVKGNEIDVYLPEGEYRVGLFPRNIGPHPSGAWRARVIPKTAFKGALDIFWGGTTLGFLQRRLLTLLRNKSPCWLKKYARTRMPRWTTELIQARMPR
jgi:hypothetical protein